MTSFDPNSDSLKRLLEQATDPAESLLRQLEVHDGAKYLGESSSFMTLVEQARAQWKEAEAYKSGIDSIASLANASRFGAIEREAQRYQEQSSSLRAMMASTFRLGETLAGQAELSKRIFERENERTRFFERLSSDGSAFLEALEESNRVAEAIRRSVQGWSSPSELGAWSQVRSLVETLERATTEAASGSVELTFGDDEGEAKERREAAISLDNIVGAAVAQPNLHQLVADILEAVKVLQGTKKEKYLWLMLVPFLSSLLAGFLLSPLAPIFDFYEKKALEHPSPQEETKAVKQAARENVADLRTLSAYRFVSSKQQLTVFATPRSKSVIVGSLRFGQTVRVLKVDRDFTLVEWASADGEVRVQGWVFSRYLKRFD